MADSPTSAPRRLESGTRRPPLFRHPKRAAIIAGALFTVAALLVAAAGTADTDDLQTAEPQPKEVESFGPAQGSFVGPTAPITVDLRDDLVGEFTICAPTPTDCTPIPLDQTRIIRSLGQVSFRPTDATEVTDYPTGPVTVRVDYHLQGAFDADNGSFTWSFVVKA